MPLNSPLRHWQGRSVWLVGASTGIGRATASALHARGARVIVSARNAELLQSFADSHPADPATGRVAAQALPLDVTQADAVRAAAEHIRSGGPIDLAFYCAGYYKPQRATAYDLADMLMHDQVNYVGALHLLDAVLPDMLARRSGHISLISSVAGYSGLPKSLAYGPTKAALINLAETLYLDLQDAGLGVSLVNPGFVETPLTAQNEFHMPALITPEQAAQAILAGWADGEFEIHFPKRFTRWMKLISQLPYSAYFPLVRRMTGL